MPQPAKTSLATDVRPRYQQTTLHDWTGNDTPLATTPSPTIEASGDILRDKPDNIVRFAFQNINGISLREDLHMMPEVATIGALQIDIAGFSETNIHWSHDNRHKMQMQMSTHLGRTELVCASGTSRSNHHGYHPGGTMLAIMGPQCGRMTQRGADPWGRFTWTTMRGGRDEGLLIITAYRVCQKKGAKVGVKTAYTQQIDAMIAAGDKTMDPRSRVLSDIQKLILSKRDEGFRPIVMLDANDDWTNTNGGKQFSNFMQESHLQDPLHQKFHRSGLTPTTYSRGTRRIDYILVDSTIVPAIRQIGTLGLHEGVISDHVMLYMDCDETELFRGVINRPVMNPSREFTLEQADKCARFCDLFRDIAQDKRFKERAITLSQSMHANGATDNLILTFHNLDKEIQQCLLSVARKVTKKKFGYQRSPQLTTQGTTLHFWKAVLSAKRRGQQLPATTIKQADFLNIDIDNDVRPLTTATTRIKVRTARHALWEVQKQATAKRVEWLETNAQNIAKAAGTDDWKAKMNEMARNAESRGIHRHMTQALKGSRQGLDSVEVPIFRWFHSKKTGEVYKYDSGVFEAYAPYTPQPGLIPTNPTQFFSHHHLKAIPSDATPAHVVRDGQWLRLITIFPATNIWREVTDPIEIERLLNNRNKRHLQQVSLEEGRIHHDILQRLMADHGTSDIVDDLYNGVIDMDACTDEAVQAWVKVMRKTTQEIDLPKITGEITQADFQSAFKAVKEKTSSSPSGLHYSIWKCIAKQDEFAEWLCIMMSLPFQFGFTNTRWTKSVDVMLEKSPGVRHIHRLRIIGLVEADFNTALKILFARKLMWNAEKSGLHNEQWGGRPNRTAIDAAMRKMMTFEYGRYMKMTIALFANDQTACFDRMCPPISNVIAGKFGMDANVLRARSNTMAQMQRHIKTNLGVSETSYQQQLGEPTLHGEYQGKGDVASLWVMHSSTVLYAHAQLYKGLSLPDIVTGKVREKNNDVYVDDADTWASSWRYGSAATTLVSQRITHGAQMWTNAQDVCGGATAFDKCAVQCLSWTEQNGSLSINMDRPPTVLLKDIRGACSKIRRLKANEPNVGLGYSLAPDGNQTGEYNVHRSKVAQVCDTAANMMLTETTAAVMLQSRLIPKMKYGLYLSQFSVSQCKKIDTIINKTFLPRMRIHSKTPLSILHGPLSLGGMAFVKDLLLQDQASIVYLIQTLRWDNETSQDVLQTLQTLQLATGFVTPVMEDTTAVISYVSNGWLLHIRSRLGALNGSIWIEKAWQPALQRLGDESIMEKINALPYPPSVLRKANECRLWLRVITIAELASLNGKTVPMDRLQGKWRAQSSLHWPNQPTPSQSHWAAFRKCIRATFCCDASAWQRHGEYHLTQPLGAWVVAHRHVQHPFYITHNAIIMRSDNKLFHCSPTYMRGHYRKGPQIPDIPTPSHPTDAQQMAQGAWTHRRLSIHVPLSTDFGTHIIIHDTFHQTSAPVNVVSDASVHTRLKKAAVAWLISGTPDNQRQAVIRKTAFEDSTSYRLELEGMYDSLTDAQQHLPDPTTIKMHCDCESGIKKLGTTIRKPRDVMAAEMDMIMALQQLQAESIHDIAFFWVKGHADKDRPVSKLTNEEQMNVQCDTNANDCVAADTPDHPFTPLPGTRAMLKLGTKWITSRYEDRIRDAHTSVAIREYAIKRLNITGAIYDEIDWPAIGRVQKRHKSHRKIRTVKMLWRWLPVGHNWRHHGATTDICPGCGTPDETFDHLLACDNPLLKKTREDGVAAILRVGKARGIPLRVLHAALRVLRITTHPNDNTPVPTNNVRDHVTIRHAIDSQQRIGFARMATGFLSTKWFEAIQACSMVEYPQQCLDDMLALIWDHLCEPVWHCRNRIFHAPHNQTTLPEMSQQIDRLLWYLKYQREALDYRHHFLIDYDAESVQRTTRGWRHSRVAILDHAHKSYKTECNQKAAGQRVITQYMIRSEEDPQVSFAHAGNTDTHAHATTGQHRVDPAHVPVGPSGPHDPRSTETIHARILAKNVHPCTVGIEEKRG